MRLRGPIMYKLVSIYLAECTIKTLPGGEAVIDVGEPLDRVQVGAHQTKQNACRGLAYEWMKDKRLNSVNEIN